MTKKNFRREDPTMDFITPRTQPTERTASEARATSKGKRTGSAPTGYKLNPEYIETKSRRVQILIQPSVHEAIKAKAETLGISTNEAINEALRQYTEG